MKQEIIVGVIPARYASVRLPAKPLVDLCGKPMIKRVYEQAKQSRFLTRVVVATDHDAIMDVVQSFGGEAMLTSPDLKSGSDRVAAVAETLTDASIIVNIQGDEPLIAPRMIDQTITPMLNNANVQVSTPVKKITTAEELRNPNVVKVVLDVEKNGLYFSRSTIPYLRDTENPEQQLQRHIFYKHIGLYVYRRDALLKFTTWNESPLEQAEKLEQLRFLHNGVSIKTVETEFDSIPIDTAEDAERVRTILQQQFIK